MNQHNHKHDHHGDHHSSGHRKNQGLHKDWRLWVAVVLMLGAMAMYVLSDDESIQPGGEVAPPVDAAP